MNREPSAQTLKLAFLEPEQIWRILNSMTLPDALEKDAEFERWAHENQLPPKNEGWRTWLMLAGRGFGKTRAGADMDREDRAEPPGGSDRACGRDDRRGAAGDGRGGERRSERRTATAASGEMGAEPGTADLAERERSADLLGRQSRRSSRAGA